MTLEDRINLAFGPELRIFAGRAFEGILFTPPRISRLLQESDCMIIRAELVDGFSWASTKQGYHFWEHIIHELARKDTTLWVAKGRPLFESLVEKVEVPALEDML